MIPVNELRCGNWVMDGYGFNARITNIHPGSVRLDTDESWAQEKINPIPLSPSVLEACGFDKTGSLNFNYTTYHLMDNDCWLVNIGFDLNEPIWGYFIQTSANKPEWFQIAELSYLHHLQNLRFALTNTELPVTFKNEKV